MKGSDKLIESSGKMPKKERTSETERAKTNLRKGLLKARQQKRLDKVNWTKEQGYYLYQKALESKSGPLVTIEGKDYKMLSSYDYLGLIGNTTIENAAINAIKMYGTGAGGVRLLTGTNKLHLDLEEKLAAFKGTQSSITFSSGYLANLAVLSSLMDSSDLALVDSKIHQSTIDACKLTGIPHRRYDHNDPNSLEDYLKRFTPKKRVLVISEGMFSMDGDICILKEIVDLKNKYGALLMIDEAHSFGVLGKQGRGVNSHFNISPDEIDIFTGSLSKAIPANGGYVAASNKITSFLQHGSSPYIFSAAMGPASVASVLTALSILETDTERHKKLWGNTLYLRIELQKLGYNTGLSTTPILPIMLGNDEVALNLSKSLYDHGILATPVIFPAVSKNESRLRLCVTAAQERAFLEEIVQVFRKLAN